MPIPRTAILVIGLMVLAAALTACRHYWGKPAATVEQFNRDSTECAKEASPTPQYAAYGVGSEKIYKACLRSRGWAREKRSISDPGEGWFRGIENWD
jgi:hypothetical protein